MKVIILSLILIGTCSCKHEEPLPYPVSAEPLVFVILDKQGVSLIQSENTVVKTSSYNTKGAYFELGAECAGGGCKFINEFPASRYRPYNFFYWSGALASSSIEGSKDWRITLGGKTDTLFCDVQRDGQQFALRGLAFNGQPVRLDTTLTPRTYVLQRRH